MTARSLSMLLLALCFCFAVLHAQPAGMRMDMDDMPDDPVSGEMVMSTAHNFELKNGQRLRFARAETLQQFLHDPQVGLGEVVSGDDADVAAEQLETAVKAKEADASVLCPVCGMETSATGGPMVRMAHGDQAVHTCSMFHAHQVHDQIMLFRDEKSDSTAATGGGQPAATKDEGFCTGSGTTMLNGFGFTQGVSPCILLWFPGWVLNTPWRYLLGCCLVTLTAVFNEYLLQLRRVLRKESSLKRAVTGGESASEVTQLLRSTSAFHMPLAQTCAPAWFRTLSPDKQHAIHCFLHGFTILIAYMLMLVSMTYDYVLFACCIVGYVAGHYSFGERRDAVGELSFPLS